MPLSQTTSRRLAQILSVLALVSCAGAEETSTTKLLVIPLTANTEFVEQWYTCGPFPRTGSPEVLKRWASAPPEVPPENSSFFSERYKSKRGPEGWILHSLQSVSIDSADPRTKEIRSLPCRIINLHDAYPDLIVGSSAYALALIDSPGTQTRTLLMGSDDGMTVWLNGTRLHRNEKERPVVPDEDFAIARFRPGLNALLVEVTNASGYWGFMLRLHGEQSVRPPIEAIDIESILD